MDQDQATRFVLDRARAGFGVAEISAELSRELNAPPEITRRFVARVIAEQPEPAEAPVPPAEAEPAPESPPERRYSNLPPGLWNILAEYEAAGSPRPREAQFPAGWRKPEKAGTPRQAAFVPPSPGAVKPEGAELSPEARRLLVAEILRQLKKRRRINDVIEDVCVETGWHWNKAQRFVARVQTEHYDELHAEEKRWKVLTGAGVALGGLILTLFGGKRLFDYAELAVFAKTNPGALLGVSAASTFFALVLVIFGGGMLIGGIYYIGRGLTER